MLEVKTYVLWKMSGFCACLAQWVTKPTTIVTVITTPPSLVSAGILRMRRVRAYAETQSHVFASRDQRRIVEGILDDIVTSDTHVSLQEASFLSVVREVLQI
jgi:hypothetical protein